MCQTVGCCRGGHTFVCFNCQMTAKALDPGQLGGPVGPKKTNKTFHPVCPRCRQPMRDLGIRVSVPSPTHKRRWRNFEKRFGPGA